MDNLPTEGIGMLGAEEGGKRGVVYVAVGVVVGFVVAAGEYIAVGGEDTTCP